MKIPITKESKERLWANALLTVMFVGLCLLTYYLRGEEYITETIIEFYSLNGGGTHLLAVLTLFLGVLWYLAISSLTEYDVQKDGLYVMPRFGKSFFNAWTEFVYVGAIRFPTGVGGPGKIFPCAKSFSRKNKQGLAVLPKEKS